MGSVLLLTVDCPIKSLNTTGLSLTSPARAPCVTQFSVEVDHTDRQGRKGGSATRENKTRHVEQKVE